MTVFDGESCCDKESRTQAFHSGFCLAFLESCETKSGMESLGLRLSRMYQFHLMSFLRHLGTAKTNIFVVKFCSAVLSLGLLCAQEHVNFLHNKLYK